MRRRLLSAMLLVLAAAGAVTLSATQSDKERITELRLPKEIRVKPRGENRSTGCSGPGQRVSCWEDEEQMMSICVCVSGPRPASHFRLVLQ